MTEDKVFKYSILAAIIICIVPFTFYICKFDGGFSNNIEDWSGLGSFYGGIVSPILTFISIFLVAYSLRIQREELKEERKENRRKEIINRILSLIEIRKDILKDNETEMTTQIGIHASRVAKAGIEISMNRFNEYIKYTNIQDIKKDVQSLRNYIIEESNEKEYFIATLRSYLNNYKSYNFIRVELKSIIIVTMNLYKTTLELENTEERKLYQSIIKAQIDDDEIQTIALLNYEYNDEKLDLEKFLDDLRLEKAMKNDYLKLQWKHREMTELYNEIIEIERVNNMPYF